MSREPISGEPMSREPMSREPMSGEPTSGEHLDERYDIIVFGATSFVGQLVCEYLMERERDGGAEAREVRWAIAGRSSERLEALRARLSSSRGERTGSLGERAVIIADAHDDASLRALCARTRVVLSTVGPYALYGELLIKACVEAGVDYCDLTGEVQWMNEMITRYEMKAQESGSRIVHCCGFDSIPSDLGVRYLQAAAQERFGVYATRVSYRLKRARGGFSGGTIASLLNLSVELSKRPELRRVLSNPYALCPTEDRPTTRQPNVTRATFDEDHRAWSAPFVMAGVNTRVVQRSHALSGYAYGDDFMYDEATLTGAGLKGRVSAHLMTLGLGALLGATMLAPTRRLLQRFFFPAPGEGPSPEAQRSGFFDIRLTGHTTSGDVIRVQVTGDRDPGYSSTARMIVESALTLAFERSRARGGGFWTPATLLGDPLIERLITRGGLTFNVLNS